ncbi:hypothetical protein BH20PSE1_BH20PSE1_17870 [soil metagenome]
MKSIFSIVRVAFVIIGSVCLLPATTLAGPPDWAPAHGYRDKHEGKHQDKHHYKKEKHHRDRAYEHSRYSEDDDSSEDYRRRRHDDRYLPDYDKDDGVYPRPVPDRRVWRDDRLAFVKGECTPRLSGRESGAALGEALASQVGTGNAAMVAKGTLLGAVLGSQAERRRRPLTKIVCSNFWNARAKGNRSLGTAFPPATRSRRYVITARMAAPAGSFSRP